MARVLDARGKPTKSENKVMDTVLFRWIILMLLSVAAKVLNVEEAIQIRGIVNKTTGGSPIVNGFHDQLMEMMGHVVKEDTDE